MSVKEHHYFHNVKV